MIQLSIEFDNYHTVNSWYNLTNCKAVYIGEEDGRLGVAIDLGQDGIYWVFVNESVTPYSDTLVLKRTLKDILDCIVACFPYYGHEDGSERHRFITKNP